MKAAAEDAGVTILTINALQRFNDWDPDREREAEALASYAEACGAKALILVPTNDGSGREHGERQDNLETALRGLKPILRAHGITGLVEPLGFESCALRSKREAVEGIRRGRAARRCSRSPTTPSTIISRASRSCFRSGRAWCTFRASRTKASRSFEMRDSHRVLVGPGDLIGNVEQVAALLARVTTARCRSSRSPPNSGRSPTRPRRSATAWNSSAARSTTPRRKPGRHFRGGRTAADKALRRLPEAAATPAQNGRPT